MTKRTCPRCSRPYDYVGLCAECEHDLDISDEEMEHTGLDDFEDSEYDRRLADGFAIMDADENPYDYDERWS